MRTSHPWFGLAAAIALVGFAPSTAAQIGIEQCKLVASDGADGDEFGISQALEGDTLVLGADQKDSRRGAVYVFTRQPDGTWAELQKLTASDPSDGAEFGHTVAISGDWIAVGARLESNIRPTAGAVYMFEKQGGLYSQTEKLQGNDTTDFDHFGTVVELEGDRMIVSAPRDDDRGRNSGSVYVFEESGGSWSQVDKVVASDGAGDDFLGFALSLDGDRFIIGSLFDDGLTGSAYVFELQGGNWTEVDKLTASDRAGGDEYGSAVALCGDVLLIGARLEEMVGNNAGSVYAYEFDGANWNEVDKFVGSDTAPDDQFGFSIGLDGTRAVISAHRSNPSGINNAGKTYLFELQDDGTWDEVARLFVRDPAEDDFQGWATDLDGHRIAVTAVWDDANGNNAGAAYIAEGDFLRSADSISVSAGGTLEYYVNLGVAEGGSEFWVLGSFTGIDPGLRLHRVSIPLNFDQYFLFTFTNPNVPPYNNSRGVLDANGSATFSINAPAGLPGILVGLELHHAALTFTSPPIRFTGASHATPFVFVN